MSEIDLTHPSLDTWPLYTAVGVPEVWRYDGEQVLIDHLHGARSTVPDTSTVLFPVTSQYLTVWRQQQRPLPDPAWFRAIQDQGGSS